MQIDRRAFALSAASLALAGAGLSGSAAAQTAPDLENTVHLDTKDGRVVIRLRPDLAPKHVAQIKTLVKEGFYDGIVFHRVIEGFMAQTGDPTGTGTGGSKLPNLPAEFSAAPFRRGTLGMARAASPDSANSQFFICFADARFLDKNYTVFGEVASGMEFVDKIKKGAGQSGMVQNPDKIVRMRMAADAK
jgi:peptidylprolyl isomerase